MLLQISHFESKSSAIPTQESKRCLMHGERAKRRRSKDIHSAHTFSCPEKWRRSLTSRKALLARMAFSKTLVTFLMATSSPVWVFFAALCSAGNPERLVRAKIKNKAFNVCKMLQFSTEVSIDGTVPSSPFLFCLWGCVSVRTHGRLYVPNNAIGALSNLTNELVLCVDNELLVQDWERMSRHRAVMFLIGEKNAEVDKTVP